MSQESDILMIYIREFIAISDHLKNTEKARIHKGLLLIKKSELEPFLSKNLYNTADNKLRIWKSLEWISAEDRRLTKRVRNSDLRSYEACICIKIKVYETLKSLMK